MHKSVRRTFVTIGLVALATQLSFAQPADYFLERVKIHAQLMQAKAPLPMSGGSLGHLFDDRMGSSTETTAESEDAVFIFARNLEDLVADVDLWKDRLPASQSRTYQEARKELQEHIRSLKSSSAALELTAEQSSHCDLLLLELEQAAMNIDSEYLELAMRTDDRRRRRSRTRFDLNVGPAWNAWGGPWGGWGAGPYFGQPFGPGFGPRCW